MSRLRPVPNALSPSRGLVETLNHRPLTTDAPLPAAGQEEEGWPEEENENRLAMDVCMVIPSHPHLWQPANYRENSSTISATAHATASTRH